MNRIDIVSAMSRDEWRVLAAVNAANDAHSAKYEAAITGTDAPGFSWLDERPIPDSRHYGLGVQS